MTITVLGFAVVWQRYSIKIVVIKKFAKEAGGMLKSCPACHSKKLRVKEGYGFKCMNCGFEYRKNLKDCL